MYVIQYEKTDGTNGMQNVDTKSRHRIVQHLATYQRPIVAVYENTTPVTRELAKRLREWPGTLSREAKAFAHSTVPA